MTGPAGPSRADALELPGLEPIWGTVAEWLTAFLSKLDATPPRCVAEDAVHGLLEKLNCAGFPIWDLCDGDLLCIPARAFDGSACATFPGDAP